MAKPWEQYQPKQESKPWEAYAAPSAPEPLPEQTLAQEWQQAGERPIGQRLENIVQGMPRAAGLGARSLIEGLGGTVEFLGTPLKAAMQYAGYDPSGGGQRLADYLGLPQPETPTERITGAAGQVLGGAGGMLGLAGKVSQATSGVTQQAAKAMAARPELQLSSAVGAGTAGGVTKETGGGPVAQVIASVLGGVAAPIGVAGAQRTLEGVKSAYQRLTNDPQMSGKINLILETAAKDQGINFGEIAPSIKNQLNQDMQAALKRGEMSPDVVRRLIDYRITGLTPTAGPLTLDPGIITKQKNLSKLGVSSQDPRLQRLSQIENENNRKLIENLNRLGANKAGSNAAAGQKVIDALDQKQAAAQDKIGLLYNQARGAEGRSAQLDPRYFTQKANDLLDDAMIGGKLPSDVRNNLNRIAKGEMPLTVDVAEQFKTNIASLQRATIDRAEKMALGKVREALDDTPMLGGQSTGKEAIQAFNTARAANREWMTRVDDIPALKAVVEGVEPDKFVSQYITGTGKAASINNVMKLRSAIKDSPEAMGAVKNNMAQFLKDKALSGAADEVGNFSQSGYNRALNSIGDAKLKLFFTPDEFKALKAIGRVASYEQVQPKGAAVNNSNTASAAIAAVLDRIGGSTILRKIPLGAEFVGNPLKSISGGLEAGLMTKIPTASPAAQPSMSGAMTLPPAVASYLMSTKQPSNDNR